jgi:hypothetical protein
MEGLRLGARTGAFLLTVIAAWMLVSGCDSGGDSQDKSATPDLLQTATARSSIRPTIIDGIVNSSGLGYTSELSADWAPQPTDDVAGGKQDTFTLPGEGQVSAIQVRCLGNLAGGVEALLTTTNAAFASVTPGPARTVDGHEAVTLQYLAGRPPAQVSREDVFFETPRCAWTISLVTPVDQKEAHAAVFEQFVEAFRPAP